MIRLAKLAAVILPAAGLAALWATSDRTYHTGTEWEVPIQGYDPRDILRGHYVEFSYDWPGLGAFSGNGLETLCLEGEAPLITRVDVHETDADCAHPVRADTTGVYGWDALTRGRLYVDQNRAAKLEQELRKADQRGFITIRQRNDGSFTPVAIRFRPLTPQEIAERDAQIQGAEDLRPPPPIMSPSADQNRAVTSTP